MRVLLVFLFADLSECRKWVYCVGSFFHHERLCLPLWLFLAQFKRVDDLPGNFLF